jgi:hypothetical protein
MPTWLETQRLRIGTGHLSRPVSPRIPQNFKCHSTAKLCPSTSCTFFSLGGFEVFREILENMPKFQNGIKGLRESKGF